jgi:hypothetical protein
MRRTFLASFLIAAAVPTGPAVAASDFRLPGSAPTPPPDRQGPVVPDVPASRAPAPTPTPAATPAPRATAAPPPTPTPAAQPGAGPPRAAAAPTRVVRHAPNSAAPTVAAPLPPSASPATPGPATSDPVPASPALETAPSLTPGTVPTAAASEPQGSGSFVPWLLGLLAGLGLAAAGGVVWWRWRQVAPRPFAAMPEVVRPRVAPVPAAPAVAGGVASPAAAPEPLQIALEPVRLSLTLMTATLAYRLEVANRAGVAIEDLRIGADMIAAHASMTREQQLSGPGGNAPVIERIARLEPNETRIVEGEFRVPFSHIVPIRQGSAALLLPLARFRLEALGAKPLVRTFVVGQPGAGANLQPFRLDLGPRVYPKLAQHAFA